jgi:DNA polymerase-1
VDIEFAMNWAKGLLDAKILEGKPLETLIRYYNELKDARSKAKTTAFGLQYGAGERPDIGITKQYLEAYFKANSGFKSYQDDHKLFVATYGYTRTLFGRKKRNPDALFSAKVSRGAREAAFRSSFSGHIQGTAGDLIKLAMVKVYNYIVEHDIPCWIIAQVHDELLFECRDDWVDHMKEKIQYLLENVLEGNKVRPDIQRLLVPLPAEPSTGRNWKEAKG